jgi:hypothetical protein
MTQCQLDRAVARATGENLRVISRLGFSLADPIFVEHDPEPCDVLDKYLDWDLHELERNVPVTVQRVRQPAFA